MERGACRRDLRKPPLDSRVDVLIRVDEGERAGIELPFDASQPSLDGSQLRRGNDSRARKAARMGDAAGDVEGIELEVRLERGREAFELGEKPPLEPASPQLPGLAGYGASLFMSPSRLPSSRERRLPWTCEAVLTPIPHSLMKPAAAD